MRRCDAGRVRGTRTIAALLCLLLPAIASCYYGHLAVGQTRLLWARRGVDAVLADPDTPGELRRQIELVAEARSFGARLGLDVGKQYTSFVDWQGDRVVTTVVATRPGEVEPAGFRFPLVGTLPYKGFFDREGAEAEARQLREQGYDVCLLPITAYSTLGWIADPLTAPMLRSARTPGALVETVLHELVHATVFVSGQADFNEGLAQAFAEEAVLRFADERPQRLGAVDAPRSQASAKDVVAGERARISDRRRLALRVLSFRDEVAQLYASESDAQLRGKRRAVLEAEARAAIASLELATGDARSVAERAQLGDACLAIRGTYAADAPLHAARLAALGGDLRAFLEAARAAAREDDPRRAFFGDLLPGDVHEAP